MASNRTITQELGQITTPLIDSDIFIISRDNRNTTTTTFANLADSLFAASQYNTPNYTRFAVVGSGTLIADKQNDTLKLVGGQNINIFASPTTDTITIASNSLNDPGSAGIVVRTQPFETITRSVIAGEGIEVINGSGVGGNIEIYNRGILDVIPETPRIILSRDGGNLSINLRETDENIPTSLVLRNDQGDFSARRITADTFIGNLSGIAFNAEQADKLTEPFTLSITGDVFGNSVEIDGTTDVEISLNIRESSVRLGIETTGQYIRDVQVDGTGLSKTVTNTGDGQNVLITSNATPNKVAGTLVSRDAFGGFSTGSLDIIGNISVSGNSQIFGNLNVLGGSLTTSAGSFDLIPNTARTINLGLEASTINIGALQGTTHVRHNLEVAGNLVVRGETTTVNSNVTTITDPVITLGANSIQGDSSDRGIEFEYYDDQGFKQLGFIGYKNGDNTFALYTEASLVDGNYSGIIGNLLANAKTAEKLTFPRLINLDGDVKGTVLFDGLSDVVMMTTIQADSVQLGVDTTGSYVRKAQTQGWGISGAVDQEAGTFVVTSSATNNPTPDTIVYRNSAGDFAANIITANRFIGQVEVAERLANPFTISIEGAVAGSAVFNGQDDVTINVVAGDNTVELGVNTTGQFVKDVVAGEGIAIERSDEEANIITVLHGNTSDTTSSINFGPTLIQGIGVDKFGHIVSINAVDAGLIFYTQQAAEERFISTDGGVIVGDLEIGGNLTVLGETQANVRVSNINTPGDYYITFVDRTEGYGELLIDSEFTTLTYNPAAGLLKASKLQVNNIRLDNKLLEFFGANDDDKVGISRISIISPEENNTDFWFFGGTGTYAEIASGNDGHQPIYVRQYEGDPSLNIDVNQPIRTLTLLDELGNTTIPENLIVSKSITATNDIITDSKVVVNGLGRPDFGQGQVLLNASQSNRIEYRSVGFEKPTFTTRSLGTKILLKSELTGTATDYAIGLADEEFWFSTPTLDDTFVWYGATTPQMSLTNKNLTVEQDVIVKRDITVQRNVTANKITAAQIETTSIMGDVNGNADTATRLKTPRNINGVAFDGTQNITITSSTTNRLTFDQIYFSGGQFFDGSTPVNLSLKAGTSNTGNTLVYRDVNGNFAANIITANLTGNASTATKLLSARNISISGGATANPTPFDGSASITLNVSSLNANAISSGVVRIQNGGTGLSNAPESGQILIGNQGSYSLSFLDDGPGIDIQNGGGSITITNNDRGSAQNIFKNISDFTGNPRIIASNNNDTLKFIATGKASISFDNTEKSITISADTSDILIESDNTSNFEYFPVFSDAFGEKSSLNISELKLKFNPSSGNLTSNTFTGSLIGNANTASRWQTPRTFTINGDAVGAALVDGASNVVINLELSNTGVNPSTYGGTDSIPVISVDEDGRITSATQVSISEQYFTRTEADQRFVNVDGDTITGPLVVASTLRHSGLIFTSGTNIDQLYSMTFEGLVNSTWVDVGINGQDLQTGSYTIQLNLNDDYYTGIMSWYSGINNSDTFEEIVLHKAGPGATPNLYLRVLRRSGSVMSLQISSNDTQQVSRVYNLKLRRTI